MIQLTGERVTLALALCAALLLTLRRRSLAMAAIGGLLIGGLALVEVYYVALWLLAPALLMCAEYGAAKPNWKFAAGAAAMLVTTAGLVLSPWMARNYALFGDAALKLKRGELALAIEKGRVIGVQRA